METYYLTVFKPDGEKLLNESFEASNDTEAEKIGRQMLEEKELTETTHRCISPRGKILLFHP